MKDLLKNLREHLSAMIEEIDNYTHNDLDKIVIEKYNFKYLKCLFSNSDKKIFKYKDDIFFSLDRAKINDVSFYEKEIHDKMLGGTLDLLILYRLEEPISLNKGAYNVNYKIESYENYKLRTAYRDD